ncbi:MAG: hypothetical protein WDO24_26335 [Pseudomonadota bacterium]
MPRVFEALGIPLEKFFFFADDDQLATAEDEIARMGPIAPCPRVQISRSRRSRDRPTCSPAAGRPVVGLQLGGSRYSIARLTGAGLASKALPTRLADWLMAKDVDILLLGSAEEIDSSGIAETPRLKFVCFPDIVASLAHVALCTALIGSDSVFKTMSTHAAHPNDRLAGHTNRDDFRERIFIRPYIADGVLSVFRYATMDHASEFNRGIDFTEAALRKLIGVS